MTDDERARFWAIFLQFSDNRIKDFGHTPAGYRWYENAHDTQLVFSAMLDLHERVLGIEKRLNETGGDGK